MKHVVFEGLPAVGKSEVLQLLARSYPRSVRILPELVKEVVLRHGIDLFNDRDALTDALRREIPSRRQSIERILRAGYICLEESHLGVHYAYAKALGDSAFVDAYPTLRDTLPPPDAFVSLDIDPEESVVRQAARGTPGFDVDRSTLCEVADELRQWHDQHSVPRFVVDANRPPSAIVGELEALLHLPYGATTGSLTDAFDVLLLLGRPASGKSELIDYLEHLPADVRARALHIAPFAIIDDFPILWEKFLEDDVWEAVGGKRLHSKRCNGNYAVTDDRMWPFLIDRIADRATPWIRDETALDRATLIVEFSRGGRSGYRDALDRLPRSLLSRAAILYVSVSFEESWRRNVARYVEKEKDGILTHSVPREEMERTYGMDDWETITGARPAGTVPVCGIDVPFCTMSNEPESTDPDILAPRYRAALDTLHALRPAA